MRRIIFLILLITIYATTLNASMAVESLPKVCDNSAGNHEKFSFDYEDKTYYCTGVKENGVVNWRFRDEKYSSDDGYCYITSNPTHEDVNADFDCCQQFNGQILSDGTCCLELKTGTLNYFKTVEGEDCDNCNIGQTYATLGTYIPSAITPRSYSLNLEKTINSIQIRASSLYFNPVTISVRVDNVQVGSNIQLSSGYSFNSYDIPVNIQPGYHTITIQYVGSTRGGAIDKITFNSNTEDPCSCTVKWVNTIDGFSCCHPSRVKYFKDSSLITTLGMTQIKGSKDICVNGELVTCNNTVIGSKIVNYPADSAFNPNVISVMSSHVCAVKSDAKVSCWGYNYYGQTSVPSSLSNVISVSTGLFHSCAVTSEGYISCWGLNSNGQTSIPSGLSGNAVAVELGAYFSCAIKKDGLVTCWGKNDKGQLNVPGSVSGAVSISAGLYHACAVKSNGAVICWGDSTLGKTSPPSLTNAISVSSGTYNSCAVKSDGKVTCWGADYYGFFNQLQSLTNVLGVSLNPTNACVVKSDGTVSCFGGNSYGQSTPPSGLLNVISVTTGTSNTCAVKSNGDVICWGLNDLGQSTPPTDINVLTPKAYYYCIYDFNTWFFDTRAGRSNLFNTGTAGYPVTSDGFCYDTNTVKNTPSYIAYGFTKDTFFNNVNKDSDYDCCTQAGYGWGTLSTNQCCDSTSDNFIQKKVVNNVQQLDYYSSIPEGFQCYNGQTRKMDDYSSTCIAFGGQYLPLSLTGYNVALRPSIIGGYSVVNGGVDIVKSIEPVSAYGRTNTVYGYKLFYGQSASAGTEYNLAFREVYSEDTFEKGLCCHPHDNYTFYTRTLRSVNGINLYSYSLPTIASCKFGIIEPFECGSDADCPQACASPPCCTTSLTATENKCQQGACKTVSVCLAGVCGAECCAEDSISDLIDEKYPSLKTINTGSSTNANAPGCFDTSAGFVSSYLSLTTYTRIPTKVNSQCQECGYSQTNCVYNVLEESNTMGMSLTNLGQETPITCSSCNYIHGEGGYNCDGVLYGDISYLPIYIRGMFEDLFTVSTSFKCCYRDYVCNYVPCTIDDYHYGNYPLDSNMIICSSNRLVFLNLGTTIGKCGIECKNNGNCGSAPATAGAYGGVDYNSGSWDYSTSCSSSDAVRAQGSPFCESYQCYINVNKLVNKDCTSRGDATWCYDADTSLLGTDNKYYRCGQFGCQTNVVLDPVNTFGDADYGCDSGPNRYTDGQTLTASDDGGCCVSGHCGSGQCKDINICAYCFMPNPTGCGSNANWASYGRYYCSGTDKVGCNPSGGVCNI